jgi:hypothetical protein
MPYQKIGSLDRRGGGGRGKPRMTISEYAKHSVCVVRFNVAFVTKMGGGWRFIRFLHDADRGRFAFSEADDDLGDDVRCMSTSNTVGGKALVKFLRGNGFQGNRYDIQEDEDEGVFYIEKSAHDRATPHIGNAANG